MRRSAILKKRTKKNLLNPSSSIRINSTTAPRVQQKLNVLVPKVVSSLTSSSSSSSTSISSISSSTKIKVETKQITTRTSTTKTTTGGQPTVSGTSSAGPGPFHSSHPTSALTKPLGKAASFNKSKKTKTKLNLSIGIGNRVPNYGNNATKQQEQKEILYFAVMYCKRSRKKHKSYMDGFISISGK